MFKGFVGRTKLNISESTKSRLTNFYLLFAVLFFIISILLSHAQNPVTPNQSGEFDAIFSRLYYTGRYFTESQSKSNSANNSSDTDNKNFKKIGTEETTKNMTTYKKQSPTYNEPLITSDNTGVVSTVVNSVQTASNQLKVDDSVNKVLDQTNNSNLVKEINQKAEDIVNLDATSLIL